MGGAGKCPSDCNSRGNCRTVLAIGEDHASGTTSAATAVSAFGVTYTNWEASSQYMCECDYQVYGADCSQGEMERASNVV